MGPLTCKAVGEAGEVAAGIVKNTERIPSISGKVKYRIQDVLNKGAKIIGDVKNFLYQPLRSQVKDFIDHAVTNGQVFELTVRKATRLSPRFNPYIKSGSIVVKRIL